MRKNEEFNVTRFAKAAAFGAAIGLVISLAVLLALSAMVLSGGLSLSSTGVLVSVTVFVGALVGAMVAKRRGSGGVLVVGPSVGALLYLVFCLIRMVFYGRFLPGDGWFANLFAAIAGGALGALIVSGKKRRRKKSR